MRSRSDTRALGALLLILPLLCAAGDPLEAYRERFQQGLERFRAGDVSGAVTLWESIRGEVSDDTVYRLLYNLGKAYEILGDATRAAERYRVFVEQTDLHGQQENLAQEVIEERVDAAVRLERLEKTRARIRILPSTPPHPVQVDGGEPIVLGKVLYVAPGKHRVIVDPNTPGERRLALDLQAGQESVVDPSAVSAPRASSSALILPPAPRPPPTASSDHQRPFSPVWIAVSGGVTVVSLVVPLLAYRHGKSMADEFNASDTTTARRQELLDEYDRAKTTYAVSWAVPAAFALATGGLGWWYWNSTRERVRIQIAPSQNQALVGFSAAF